MMDAMINNIKPAALASVNGSYHRQSSQDPFLENWLGDVDKKKPLSLATNELEEKPDHTHFC